MSDNIVAAPAAAEPSAPVESQDESAVENPIEASAALDASVAPKKEEPKARNIKRLKLKIDGKDIEEDLDLDDEEGLKKHLQMSKMGHKRAQEKAELEKQVEDLLAFVKSNPRGLLKELGMNEEELAETILREAIENSKKSPEQQEKEKLQAELTAIKKEKEDLEAARKDSEIKRMQAEASKHLEEEMIGALDGVNLPNSPYIVRRVATYLELALTNNINLSIKDVIPLVQQEMRGDMKDLIASMKDDVFEEYVGKERLSNYRKKTIQAAKDAAKLTSNVVRDTGSNSNEPSKSSQPKMTVREWLKNS